MQTMLHQADSFSFVHRRCAIVIGQICIECGLLHICTSVSAAVAEAERGVILRNQNTSAKAQLTL